MESLTGHAVIPDDNGVGPPSHSGLQILRQGDVVIQELEEVIALFLLEANNVPCELWVDIQGLLASCWVCPHDGMNGSASSQHHRDCQMIGRTYETGLRLTVPPLLMAAVACS